MDNKIEILKRWLNRNAYFDEAYNVSMLKIAISLEEAEDILNNSSRVTKILKGLFWTNNLKYTSKEIQFISNKYRNFISNLVPEDLPEKERAQTIQWLTQLGKYDSNFAYNAIYHATLGSDEDDFNTFGDFIDRLYKMFPPDSQEESNFLVPKSDIERYFHWKRFMQKQDLMSIKSAEEFSLIVEDADEKIKKYQDERAYMDADEGTKLLDETDKYALYSIHNKGAACQIGKGTNWCTASPGLPYFEKYYHPEDPLFVAKSLSSDEMYQIHFGSNQFMDKDDEHIEGEVKRELLQAFALPEVESYLGTKLFNQFQKIKSKKYTEQDFSELASLTDNYISEVLRDKTPDGSWLPDNVIDEVVRQIDSGYIEEDEMLDSSADLLSKYSPQSFFEILLAPDYPDIAKRLIEESLGVREAENQGGWKHSGLSLSSLLEKDLLFQTSEVEDLFSNSEEHRSKLSEILIKEQGSSMLFRTKTHTAIYSYIKEAVPDFEQKMVESMSLDERNRLYVKFGLDSRRHVVWRLIDSNFDKRFPEALNRIMNELHSSLKVQDLNSSESYEALDLIKNLEARGLTQKFYPLLVTLIKSGLKTNYDAFTKHLPKSFEQSSKYSDLNSIIQEGHDNYIQNWSDPIDRAFPGWRTQEYGGIFLSKVFSVSENLPEARNSTWMNDEKIRLIVEKKNQFKAKLQSALAKRSQSPGEYNKKVSLPDDMLNFVATFLPNFWEVYNLQYKVNVSPEVIGKFNRSLADLKNHRGSLGADTETYYDHDNDSED
tara:strand:- start:2598 stop:4910 length:2313 start_codon:yes stop_codon:yes gene_type:complete